MELHIQSDFDGVYYVNGEFFERADSLTMSECDVVYVTVFPLSHTLLPYTVKLCGAENVKSDLAAGVRLSSDHYLLHLLPRHITVYGTSKKPVPVKSMIARLFACLRSGDSAAAYAMLGENLRAAIDKPALEKFFAGYERLAECNWEPGANKFYLIDKNGCARLHAYTVKDGFIDDIIECD